MKRTLNCRGRLLNLDKPLVMGILNATPDSFYNKGRESSEQDLLQKAGEMLLQGARILDIGGMSSRPGAEEIPVEEESRRVIPLLRAIRTHYPDAFLSVDTYRAQVAEQAMQAGADIINDISGGEADESILQVAVRHQAPFICMHKKGMPKDMQTDPTYEELTLEVLSYFDKKLHQFREVGLHDVLLDVGFGFGKTLDHNYQLLRRLPVFSTLNQPLLVGLSRKSMICKVLHCTPEQALNGTTALHMLALQQGAHILRVHDVKEAVECILLHQQFRETVPALPDL